MAGIADSVHTHFQQSQHILDIVVEIKEYKLYIKYKLTRWANVYRSMYDSLSTTHLHVNDNPRESPFFRNMILNRAHHQTEDTKIWLIASIHQSKYRWTDLDVWNYQFQIYAAVFVPSRSVQ